MKASSQRVLKNKEKIRLNIEIEQEAIEFLLEKVIEERCDEFENELEFQGFEIIDREYIPVATSIFNFKVVARKKAESC